MDNTITIFVRELSGADTAIEAPTDMSLSLMEILKGSGYPIEATCGGIALCATCHIEVLKDPGLKEPSAEESDMLDQLPNLSSNSRLACQIRPENVYDGMVVRILGEQ